MPFVEASAVIRADRQQIFELARDFESYPKYMDAVRSLKIVERGDNWVITDWVALLQGKPFHWRERDEWDASVPSIRYRQTEGDLKKFEGEWRFEQQDDGVKVSLTCDFDLGIPMFAAMLNPVAKLVVRKQCQSILDGLKERCAAAAGSASAS